MESKSFCSCFFPSSSCHFLQYLVKAFFFDLYLQSSSSRRRRTERDTEREVGTTPSSHTPAEGRRVCERKAGGARLGFGSWRGFERSHRPAEPGAHRRAAESRVREELPARGGPGVREERTVLRQTNPWRAPIQQVLKLTFNFLTPGFSL
ncbi:UNVERIFIED_CONTAM: hypothetical protein FKN15_043400 [Acipenser sinensis]